MMMQTLLNLVHGCGVTRAAAVAQHDVVYNAAFRDICAQNTCGLYGTCYMCPPDIGPIEALMKQAQQYPVCIMYQTVAALEDSFDFEGMENGMRSFKSTVDNVADAVKPVLGPVLILSNEGCGRCMTCTYPDDPCRFPDKLYPSIEGFGFIVGELAQQAGIRYNNGPNTVTFFGAVVY